MNIEKKTLLKHDFYCTSKMVPIFFSLFMLFEASQVASRLPSCLNSSGIIHLYLPSYLLESVIVDGLSSYRSFSRNLMKFWLSGKHRYSPDNRFDQKKLRCELGY